MKAYIDVRGTWPLYIRGMIVVELVGAKRTITVEEAEEDPRVKEALGK